MVRYKAAVAKVEEHFAAALSALESSFAFATSPRHIIDVVIEAPPDGIPEEEWTYQRKFEAAWEALRVEYQPSTAVDLSILRDQILSLNDQMPGGFDMFKSEFHRLRTEILATQVADAITPRELNGIVREGIRNPTVWMMVCHSIYSQDPNAPWEGTFDAISKLLTSYRQKGIDPYNEAHGGPMIGATPVAANSAMTGRGDPKKQGDRKRTNPNRDGGGRFRKAQKSSNSETYTQSKHTTSSSYTTSRSDPSSKGKGDSKCTRCWQVTSHNFRSCSESKCACGQPLASDQLICYNYDNHPVPAKFTDSVPKMLSRILDAYKKGSTGQQITSNSSSGTPNKANQPVTRSRSKKAKAMAASVAEELIQRGVTGENLDRESS